jgi:hypothetical protein
LLERLVPQIGRLGGTAAASPSRRYLLRISRTKTQINQNPAVMIVMNASNRKLPSPYRFLVDMTAERTATPVGNGSR